MGLFERIFGGNKEETVQSQVVREPLVFDQPQENVKSQDTFSPENTAYAFKPKSPQTEAELALEAFEADLDTKDSAIDRARETLYDKKAKLNTMKSAQNALQEEIEAHKSELLGIEEEYKTATEDKRVSLEIRGQNLQNAVNRKEGDLRAQRNSLATYESMIDTLENDISGSELIQNQKRSRLEEAKIAAVVIGLKDEISSTLNIGSVDTNEEGLDFFLERQKLVLDDMNGQISSAASAAGTNLQLSFKDRMKRDDSVIIEDV